MANLRGLGSDDFEFDLNRFRARGSFLYLRGSLAHTHDLSNGLQLFGKVQGQIADQPLVNSEQLAGGGLATVRGYLEAEAIGDDGVFGSFELRTPQLVTWTKSEGNDWRAYVFADGGVLTIRDALPGQASSFTLASVGIGTRFRLLNHLNGSLDAGCASAGSDPDRCLRHAGNRSALDRFLILPIGCPTNMQTNLLNANSH